MHRLSSIRPGTAVRIAFLLLLVAIFAVGAARADQGGRDKGRVRFYGLVEHIPDGGLGDWVIGGHKIPVDSATELDQEEGPLAVGGCAKVDVREGRTHEIDSEPLPDCR